MKVLHVIPSLAPSYGGPRQTVLEFCQQSQDRSWQSEICATDADGPGRLDVQLNKPVLHEGIVTHFFHCQASASLNYSRPMRQWLDDNVERYDVIHLNGIFCHATYAAATASARRGIPYVVSPHGMLEPWSLSQKRPRKLVAWYLFYRRVLKQAAAIVYSTQQERELTERALHLSRGAILPAGVPADLLQIHRGETFRARIGMPRNAPFLIALSRIHPKKGVDLLLQAFQKLKSQGHLAAWHLVVAGDGEPRYISRLRELVTGTVAEPFVHWPGWLNGEEKFQALAEAGLFVLSSFQENFGRGVVEAMACGTPVLLSPQVGLAPTVAAARAGWVANLNDDELCQALIAATSDSAGLSLRARAARELAREHFIWPRIVADTLALYERVSTPRRRPSEQTNATVQSGCNPCETR